MPNETYTLNYTAEQINHKLDLINENKNLLPYPYKTAFPVGLEDVGDGSILTYAPAGATEPRFLLNTCQLPAGKKYTISLDVTNIVEESLTESAGFTLEVAIEGVTIEGKESITIADSKVLDLSSAVTGATVKVYLNVPTSFGTDLLIKPQIEEGEEKTAWVPYMDKIGNYVDERFNSVNTKLRDVLAFMKLVEVVDV